MIIINNKKNTRKFAPLEFVSYILDKYEARASKSGFYKFKGE